jgi:NADH dehydrogenase
MGEVVNAIGPEIFRYRELVQMIRQSLGVKRATVSVTPEIGYWAGRLIGLLVGDVVITREEIRGLMEGRLYVDAPAVGTTKLSEWIEHHRETIGRRYSSELARRRDRGSAYAAN